MSADTPVIDLTPVGLWPDRTPVEALTDGPGVILVTQWNGPRPDPPAYDGTQAIPGPGHRVVSVVAYHPKRQIHVAASATFSVRPAQMSPWNTETIDPEDKEYCYGATNRVEPTEIPWHPRLALTANGQPWEETIAPRTREALTAANNRWLTRHRMQPLKTWWLPYMPGKQRLDLQNTKHWTALNNQIVQATTKPCGEPRYLAVIHTQDIARPRELRFYSPVVPVDIAHPVLRTDGVYGLYLLCRNGRCLTQIGKKAIWLTRYATVDGANMLYDLLTASGETMHTLWTDPVRAVKLVSEAEETLDRILARPGTGRSSQ